MRTIWGEHLKENSILPEYPRPQLKRNSFLNLNGPWAFYMGPADRKPEKLPETILVPFSPESELSGIQRKKGPNDVLIYRRSFVLPEGFHRGRVLLHFGAVDLLATVSVNGRECGTHRGGYWPFTYDITGLLREKNSIEVVVEDDGAESDLDARGKQSAKPGGIWYTAQSGIWQTVWMESVPEVYIRSLRLTPEYDQARIRIELTANGGSGAATADVLTPEGEFVAGSWFKNGVCVVPLPDFRSWSPADPYLYRLDIRLGEDRVESYFGMRKFSTVTVDGHRVFALNDKPIFHNGLLDQGYWPDGLLTPPSDEAMIFDIRTAKDCGFNMLRKHIKIEPLRWYYHCDRLGMLVWQDMVSGGGPYDLWRTSLLPLAGVTKLPDRDGVPYGRGLAASRVGYLSELRQTVELLYNCPCIALWTPFNEGWGQFDALAAARAVQRMDPTRHIDHASGWQDQGWPEIQSRHIYFRPIRLKNDGRALCLTEFGGYILAVAGHKWCDKVFGYKVCRDVKALERDYRKLFTRQVIPHVRREGLTAAVYTQLSDVEQEMNGLLTYDRDHVKVDAERMRECNRRLMEEFARCTEA